MGFSKTERLIANAFNKVPFLKPLVKRAYQRVNYFVYKTGTSINCEYAVSSMGRDAAESFFGYYDKSPLNKSGQYLIYQETEHPTTHKPDMHKPIDVVLFDLKKDKEIRRWKSWSYNWQQGTKLSWISDDTFIFNNYDKNSDSYFASIIDVNHLDADRKISFPVYDVKGNTALSLSFERLNAIMPDYGYRNHKKTKAFDYRKEGIYKIDLEKDTNALLVSLQQIIDLHFNSTMTNAKHWFNHVMLSPNGKHFIFLHRWIKNGVKYDALILSDINGVDIKCIADDGMVSHCYWINDTEIVSWMRDAENGDRYYRINIKDGSRNIIGENIIDKFGDGHPTVFNNKMIFDTYPNRSRIKELFIFDMESEELLKIGEFFESLKYNGETRCDLHPRFSYSGKSIFVDSVHTGKRKLYKIELEK